MQDIKHVLSSVPLFQMLDAYQLGTVAAGSRVIHANPETIVVRRGDAAGGAFLIASGQVGIGFPLNDGSEKTLAILGEKKCFGLGEMLVDRAHLAVARATRDSKLLHISRNSIFAVARENFAFSCALMTCVGHQFYSLLHDIESCTCQSPRQRLMRYLLRQRKCGEDGWIELIASKALIASRLGIAPSTFSRLLQELRGEGVIAVSGRRVRILDHEKMVSLLLSL